MKSTKKIVSLIIATVLLLSVFVIAPISASASEDYRAWAQNDSRWAGIRLGSSGVTIGSHGCLVSSVTKLIIQAGFRSPDSFNIGTFGNWLNSNGGYDGDGCLYWAKPSACVSGFNLHGNLLNYGSYNSSSYNNQLVSWVNQGFHITLQVNNGGHWIAIDEAKTKATGQVYIMDSAYNVRADLTLSSRYGTFNRAVAYTGGSTPVVDNEAPVIKGGYISQVTDSGFRVCFEATDNVGITTARVATWATGDQSDLIWHDCAYNGSGTYFVDLKRTDYAPGATYYVSHAYVYDAAGNKASKEFTKSYSEGYSVVNSIYFSQIKRETFRICCEVNDTSNIESVRVATWATGNQSDIKWTGCYFNGTSTYFAELNRNDYAKGVTFYICHVYIKFKSGKEQSFEQSLKYDDTPPVISELKIDNVSENGFWISCKVEDASRIKSVQFPTWLASDPKQSDIKWHEATIVDGIASCYIPMSEHNNKIDTYYIHVYAYDSFENLETARITVDMKAEIEKQQTTTEPSSSENQTTEPTSSESQPTEPSSSESNPTEPSSSESQPVETQPSKTDISKWNVSGIKNKTYTGSVIKQDNIIVSKDGEYADFSVKYKNNLNVGTATVTITGTGDYTGTIVKTFKITKAANPITVKVTTKTVKLAAVKKKAQTVKAITVSKAQGKVSYKLTSVPKALKKFVKINSKGVITISKWAKAKKGTYKIKVKISAAGNKNYNSKSLTKTVTIKIK